MPSMALNVGNEVAGCSIEQWLVQVASGKLVSPVLSIN